jgi:hypothetical protein
VDVGINLEGSDKLFRVVDVGEATDLDHPDARSRIASADVDDRVPKGEVAAGAHQPDDGPRWIDRLTVRIEGLTDGSGKCLRVR